MNLILNKTFLIKNEILVKIVGFNINSNSFKVKTIDNENNIIESESFSLKRKDFKASCVIHDAFYSLKRGDKYIAVETKVYKLYKPILDYLIANNNNYIKCDYYKKKINNETNMILLAIKDERVIDVKRKSDTKGYAKKMLSLHKNINCCFCNKKLNENNATTEHIIPFSQCHNNSVANFALSCVDCNNERKTTEFYEFMAIKNKSKLEKQFNNLKVKRFKTIIF